ncbi:unnamed protein product [Mytilus coruscus]|uniref:Uncharacterized protein n=1 Tax=Mytilus coruscus TaxID=42192 RepID=A0A6J8EXP8_MYTCO|nr:unnamed protein product [Mytilus coruscus]
MRYNSITTIEKGAFRNMTLLASVILANNQITTILDGAFEDVPALKYLSRITKHLGSCRGRVCLLLHVLCMNIDPNVYTADNSMERHMYLGNNKIATIQRGTFDYLPELLVLGFSGNNLTFVRNDTFAHNINLDSLSLDLFCDCNVPFWSWLKSKSFTTERVTCLDRNNVELGTLRASDFDNYNACHYTDSNGGSCSQDSSGDLTCSCVGEWTGTTCAVTLTLHIVETANHCVEHMDNFHTNWSKTAESTLATLACTGEYTGNASRYCSSDGKWEEPDYSNCISKSIQNIKAQTAKLLSGASDYNNVTTILQNLENITRNNNELRSGDMLTSSSILTDIAKYVTDHKDELSVDQLEESGGVTSLVNAVTEFNDAFNNVIDSKFSLVAVKENVVMEVGKSTSDEITVPDRLKTSDTWISDSGTEIKLKKKKNICSGLTGYSSTFYRNVSMLFPEYLITDGKIKSFNGSYGVNSIIADFTIHGTSCSDYSLIIKFDHLFKTRRWHRSNVGNKCFFDIFLNKGNYTRPFCGHWNFNATNTSNGAWSSFGSRVVDAAESYTKCEYNHTTNFAILMSPGRTPLSHHFPLSLISAIGCGVSILFLIITILIHLALWRVVKNVLEKTLMNLCVALVLSYVIFLAGIRQTENEINVIVIIIAVYKLMTIQTHAAKTPKEKSKIGLKGINVMLPLFGVMWVLGTFF